MCEIRACWYQNSIMLLKNVSQIFDIVLIQRFIKQLKNDYFEHIFDCVEYISTNKPDFRNLSLNLQVISASLNLPLYQQNVLMWSMMIIRTKLKISNRFLYRIPTVSNGILNSSFHEFHNPSRTHISSNNIYPLDALRLMTKLKQCKSKAMNISYFADFRFFTNFWSLSQFLEAQLPIPTSCRRPCLKLLTERH